MRNWVFILAFALLSSMSVLANDLGDTAEDGKDIIENEKALGADDVTSKKAAKAPAAIIANGPKVKILYELLGVDKKATSQEIETATKELTVYLETQVDPGEVREEKLQIV